MRNYNYCIKTALAVFAVALSACSSDNDIVDNNSNNQEKTVSEKKMSFSANMDAGNVTRTDFNSNSTIWAKGDVIKIVNRAAITAPDQSEYQWYGNFSIVEHTGTPYTKEEVFTGTKIQSNGDGTDSFYAFYPSDCKVGYTDGQDVAQIKGDVKTVQTAINGSYDQSLHFMTAHSNNSTFSFKNVCALLKITLTNSNISRIKVNANPKLPSVNGNSFNYTYITGAFIGTIRKTDGTTYQITANGTANEVQKTYVELRAAGDGGSAKTVIGDRTYYMVVLPVAISNGFTLTLETSDGNTIYQRVNTKTTAFERNKMYDLGTYNCSGTPDGMTALTDVVDLDLPSGTLWATKNINKNGSLVSSIYTVGDYFSWGKDHFTGKLPYGSVPSRTNNTLQSQYDWAYTYDNRYCMPVYAQIYEFYNHFPNANKKSYSGNGVTNKGAEFTAPTGTGRTIWLPYGGHYYLGITGVSGNGTNGDYWSRTYYGVNGGNDIAYCLDLIHSNNIPILNSHSGLDFAAEWVDDVATARPIRPVVTNTSIAPIY